MRKRETKKDDREIVEFKTDEQQEAAVQMMKEGARQIEERTHKTVCPPSKVAQFNEYFFVDFRLVLWAWSSPC